MRKRNSVNQLNRTASHRKAMIRNMAVSLFDHERIVTTRAKSKVLKSYAEKLITRAKKNLDDSADPSSKLHNKRVLMSQITDRGILTKLCDDLAPRYKERNGGYTRVIHLPERQADSAKMSIIELVDRKEKIKKVIEKKSTQKKVSKETKKETPKETKKLDESKGEKSQKKPLDDATEKLPKKDNTGTSKSEKSGKWFWGFKKKRGDDR